MESLVDRAEAALAVLKEWQTTNVTASIDDAVRGYQTFAEAVDDPKALAEVDASARYQLLLDMAEVGANQVARLSREAQDGTTTSWVGRRLQEAFARIVRAAGRELWSRKKKETR